jgi:integrase
VSLAEAREKRDQMRKQVANEIDPVEAKRVNKQVKKFAQENSFEAVARAWYASWAAARSPRHAEYVLRRLEADVFTVIGKRPISEIKAPELVAMMKAIEKRGALDIAKRAFQTTGQVFRYAIAHALADRNPTADVKPSDVLASRRKENYARVDAKELPNLLRKIEGYQGTPVTRLAIKLLALTFVRTGELIGAKWEEFDLEAAEWRIPAERMKMRTPHIVPLSKQAIQILQVLHGVTGHSKFLFPGERDHAKQISNNTILKALERMGYKGRMTGHGFRGLASTILHEKDFNHQHIELQLAHQERNQISASYNHAKYLTQRTKMMQWWADYLDMQLIGNVVSIKTRLA